MTSGYATVYGESRQVRYEGCCSLTAGQLVKTYHMNFIKTLLVKKCFSLKSAVS